LMRSLCVCGMTLTTLQIIDSGYNLGLLKNTE
jgi:hypothetical protein